MIASIAGLNSQLGECLSSTANIGSANCVAKAGVRLVARPVARAETPGVGAPGVGVLRATPTNRGGPVDRVGRR